jgi:hypothetical protein
MFFNMLSWCEEFRSTMQKGNILHPAGGYHPHGPILVYLVTRERRLQQAGNTESEQE